VRGPARSRLSLLLLLGQVVPAILTLEIQHRPALVMLGRKLRRALDALDEAAARPPELELGIDVEAPSHVDEREQDVAELRRDALVGRPLRCGIGLAGELLAQLFELALEVRKRPRKIRVLEADCRRASLHLSCVQERRKRLRHVVEYTLALFLLALDVLPARPHLPGRISDCLGEDVRVPPNELRVDRACHLLEIARALFLKR
jgi:hypothetical protein